MGIRGDISHKFRLDGRVALVAGAGRGIGRSAAVALAHAGAEVWLMSRTQRELDAAVAEIMAAGAKAHALPHDSPPPHRSHRTLAHAPLHPQP